MIFEKEIFNVLDKKPKTPQPGYINFYSYKGFMWYMDSDGHEYLLPGSGANLNQLIKGSVAWTAGLSFAVTDCLYLIQGASYESIGTTLDLDAADPSLDRIDVIFVDTDGKAGVLKGTPSATPVKPLVDPLTQLELTYVLLEASATEPGLTNENVYQENTEWATSWNSFAGVLVDFESTNNPKAGTKCVEITKDPDNILPGGFTGAIIDFVKTSSVSVFNSSLIINIRTALKIRTTDCLVLQLKNGSDVISQFKVRITQDSYGFDTTSTSWQTLTIPIGDFQPVSYEIDTLEIGFEGDWIYPSDVIGLDSIYFQSGVVQPTGHERGHSMVNALDHLPVDVSDRGKIPQADPVTGNWKLVDMPTGGGTTYVEIPKLQLDAGRFYDSSIGTRAVCDTLRCWWQADNKEFLNFNPEIWLFRKKRRRRLWESGGVTYTKLNKKWSHPPHLNGVKYPNSRYFSGSIVSYPIYEVVTSGMHTEWEMINILPLEKMIIPVDQFEFIYESGNSSKLNETQFNGKTYSDLRMTDKAMKLSCAFAFAIVIDNPNPSEGCSKLIGELSESIYLTVPHFTGDINYGTSNITVWAKSQKSRGG